MNKLLLVAALVLFTFPSEGVKGGRNMSPVCNPNGYTGGVGEWLIDPADNECWYLHSIPEFDGGYDNCIACHDGIQAGEW